MTVSIGYIRLDIDKLRSVHQIGSRNYKVRSVDSVESHTGKTDIVRTKRRTGSKNTHSGIAAELWRTNGQRMIFGRCVELPQKPDVRETVKPSYCIGTVKFGLKNNSALQFLDQTALSRDSELCRKVRVNFCNRFHSVTFSAFFKSIISNHVQKNNVGYLKK